MNTLKKMILLACMSASAGMFAAAKADSLGLPGDNFDLYGALELFKKSKTPEDFEKAINSNDNEVNNLDLDADGKVDYVKVIDKSKDESHSLVLQVDVSKTETQDVAVIEIEKTKAGNAHLQIVGDEELYGKNYIIEPKDDSATAASETSKKINSNDDDVYATRADNSGNNNNNNNDNNNNNNNNNSNNNYAYDPGPAVYVNVWAWPSVQYMYGPSYVVWASPWYWGYYPGWWSPWYPVYWPVYYRRMHFYHHPYYHRTNFYTCNVAHNYYYGRRTTSSTVVQYNKTGVYEKKQMVYKDNAATPGRKYNTLPANAEKQKVINQRVANEPKPFNAENKQYNAQKNNSPGKMNEPRGEIKSQPKEMNKGKDQFNKQPIEQPRQVNTQPKQFNSEPKQQPVRAQRNMGNSFPQGGGRSMGGGGMRSGGGGGGRHR